MGRKKSNRPVRTRPLPSIPRIFDCPRCEATAIRISVQTDSALVECGKCLLKQTVSNLKAIEEAVDIYGSFLDQYYENIELHEIPEMETEMAISSTTENLSATETDQESEVEETTEITMTADNNEEKEEEEPAPAPMGFVPRTKGDVLKKKGKDIKK
jgi:transcription elongation factor Elf1